MCDMTRRPNEFAIEAAKTSEGHAPFLQHSDSGKTNTDVSECSTNTEDYVTCNTDLSKRGTKPPSASSSSTTQVPGSNPILYGFDVCNLQIIVVLLSLCCVVAMTLVAFRSVFDSNNLKLNIILILL